MMTEPANMSLSPRGLDSKCPDVRRFLAAANDKLGFVPNMYGNMANLSALLETCLFGYDQFRQASDLSAIEAWH